VDVVEQALALALDAATAAGDADRTDRILAELAARR